MNGHLTEEAQTDSVEGQYTVPINSNEEFAVRSILFTFTESSLTLYEFQVRMRTRRNSFDGWVVWLSGWASAQRFSHYRYLLIIPLQTKLARSRSRAVGCR